MFYDYVGDAAGFLPDPIVFLTLPLTVLVLVFVLCPLTGNLLACLMPLQDPMSFNRLTLIITCLRKSPSILWFFSIYSFKAFTSVGVKSLAFLLGSMLVASITLAAKE